MGLCQLLYATSLFPITVCLSLGARVVCSIRLRSNLVCIGKLFTDKVPTFAQASRTWLALELVVVLTAVGAPGPSLLVQSLAWGATTFTSGFDWLIRPVSFIALVCNRPGLQMHKCRELAKTNGSESCDTGGRSDHTHTSAGWGMTFTCACRDPLL